VQLEERTPERVWEMVAKGRLHLGLTRPVLAHAALQMETQVLRQERLCAAIPRHHPLHSRKSLTWRALAGQPLIVLARREGAGSHDEILAGCRQAGFSPRLIHTPSLIGTILSYVEAGAGIGIIPESVGERARVEVGSFVPLTPHLTIPLVMVWKSDTEEPPVTAFRELMCEWVRAGRIAPRKPRQL
jgi:DNA-binding transcriptional LysR family regulator